MPLITNKIPTANPSGALLCYQQLLGSVSVTGDTSATASKSLVKNTYERWRPTNVLTVARFSAGALVNMNYVAIAAHNLTGQELLISYATSAAGSITGNDLASVIPTNNEPFIITFDDTDIYEIVITSTFANDKEIGVVYAGSYLQMPQPIYGGHNPISLNADTKYQNNISVSGQFIGRNVVRNGVEATYSWEHLTPAFIRGDFEDFVDTTKRFPFFIKWRPDKYPDEDAFGFRTNDVSVSNMGGGHDLMSATFNMRGHRDS